MISFQVQQLPLQLKSRIQQREALRALRLAGRLWEKPLETCTAHSGNKGVQVRKQAFAQARKARLPARPRQCVRGSCSLICSGGNANSGGKEVVGQFQSAEQEGYKAKTPEKKDSTKVIRLRAICRFRVVHAFLNSGGCLEKEEPV